VSKFHWCVIGHVSSCTYVAVERQYHVEFLFVLHHRETLLNGLLNSLKNQEECVCLWEGVKEINVLRNVHITHMFPRKALCLLHGQQKQFYEEACGVQYSVSESRNTLYLRRSVNRYWITIQTSRMSRGSPAKHTSTSNLSKVQKMLFLICMQFVFMGDIIM
jgi:hypothetical protein